MNCEEEGCSKEALMMCNVHNIKFCEKHYGRHCRACKNEGIEISFFTDQRSGQISGLNKKVALLKRKIVGIANQIVLSIKNSLKKTLFSLDQQKISLIKIIQKGKPENQINELLGIIPNMITDGEKNSTQWLFDLERRFSLMEFNYKVEEIEQKFKVQELALTKPTVNPVLEMLEKLDLQGKIAWCQKQQFAMIHIDPSIREIKISKDVNFVFICMN